VLLDAVRGPKRPDGEPVFPGTGTRSRPSMPGTTTDDGRIAATSSTRPGQITPSRTCL
jgi:hypothetical protein